MSTETKGSFVMRFLSPFDRHREITFWRSQRRPALMPRSSPAPARDAAPARAGTGTANRQRRKQIAPGSQADTLLARTRHTTQIKRLLKKNNDHASQAEETAGKALKGTPVIAASGLRMNR